MEGGHDVALNSKAIAGRPVPWDIHGTPSLMHRAKTQVAVYYAFTEIQANISGEESPCGTA